MATNKTALLPSASDEIARRHNALAFWLASINRDVRKPKLSFRIHRRMTPSRRLEKLHRMRATLGPPRSWLNKN